MKSTYQKIRKSLFIYLVVSNLFIPLCSYADSSSDCTDKCGFLPGRPFIQNLSGKELSCSLVVYSDKNEEDVALQATTLENFEKVYGTTHHNYWTYRRVLGSSRL